MTRRDATRRNARRTGAAGLILVGSIAAGLAAGAAQAQDATPAKPAKPAKPAAAPAASLPPPSSPDVVLNLLKLLVQQKVITQAAADGLIRQAQQQAAQERAAAAAPSAAQAPGAMTVGQGPAPKPGAAAPPPSIHVQYVPETVKQQLREEIKDEVLQTAREQNWAQPNAVPDWVSRIKVFGDFKLRYEQDMYGSGNFNQLVDFNTINGGSPYDVNPNTNSSLPPVFDTSQDRTRLRIRARLGIEADVADDVTALIRLSTGTINNPVSPNQTLGTDFNKATITLDRANLTYKPVDWATLDIGRFDNPFFSSSLVWYDELGFDGIAGTATYPVEPGLTAFLVGGAFPIENTALDFGETSLVKQPSHDVWLYAAEAGAEWQALSDMKAKFGVAYYAYENMQGEVSAPCVILTPSTDTCSTDDTRPSFLTKGNTLFALRNIVFTTTDPTKQFEPQYFGLASAFDILELHGRLDFDDYAPLHILVDADYAANLGFNAAQIAADHPVNRYGGAAGNQAAFLGIIVGYPKVTERWQWNASVDYRYLESDSVVDAFDSPDFYLGGTNAKGYSIKGNLGLAHNVWLNARWYSGTEVSGPPLAIDVLELDLNAKF